MRCTSKFLRNSIFFLAAILTGFCLFAVQLSFGLGGTALNPEFHEKLFVKHDIYSHTHKVISSSMKEFTDSLKIYSPQSLEQQKDILLLLESSITSDMIKTNLDSIREGLFRYFKGETKFLPDIYLKAQEEVSRSDESGAPLAMQDEAPSAALAKIDKINLSTVFIYINRSDIADSISFIKLSCYIIEHLPGLLLPLVIALGLISLAVSENLAGLIKWAGIACAACSMLSFAAGTGLQVYALAVLPRNIYPIAMSLPVSSEIITAYAKDIAAPVSLFLAISGLVFALLSACMLCLHRALPAFSRRKAVNSGQKAHLSENNSIKNKLLLPIKRLEKFQKILALSLLPAIVMPLALYKVHRLKEDFQSNDFATIISKIKRTDAVTQVISAKDETIYALQVKIIDRKTERPVPGIQVSVNGRSAASNKYYNETGVTDTAGAVKFNLDKGAFQLRFIPAGFPSGYQIPSPYFFDLKAAGTMIITLVLDEVNQENPGIAEIEVLDGDNKPVPGLELEIDKPAGAVVSNSSEQLDRIFSFTNSEGIAVFKLNKGIYSVKFSESKLPQKFHNPSPIDIEILPDSASRYTIRLVESKKP